jgi:DNA invertase Pin-like site-specific DNA recombinase
LKAQEEDIRRFCEYNNLEVVEIRQEVASGGSPVRPVLSKALEDTKSIKGCALITSKLDRLSRKTSFIASLTDVGANIIVAECGMNVPVFELQLRAVIAEEEKRKIAERTKRAASVKRDKGEPMGFNLPQLAGKAQEIRILGASSVKDEADRFASHMKPQIERMRNAGMSFAAICEELNLHNFKTQRGGKWYPSTVKNIVDRW